MFQRIFFLPFAIGILSLFQALYGFSQERKDSLGHLPIEYARFVRNQNQRYGFYERVNKDKNGKDAVEVFKSVAKAQTDVVDFKINRSKFSSIDSIEFFIRAERINSTGINEIKRRIYLPASNKDYEVHAKYRGNVISILHVSVLPVMTQKIRIVPLLKTKINR